MKAIVRAAALASVVLAACAAPNKPPPRVAACDDDITRFKHAARAGDARTQYRLATRYRLSWLNPGLCASGAGQDDAIEAYRWYTLAAGQGVEAAARHRDALEKAMTPAQIAEAKRRAAEWLGPGG